MGPLISRCTSDCRAVAAHLSAFRDGALDPLEHQRVQGHVDACPSCSAIVEQQQQVCGLLARAERAQAPTALADRLTSIAGGASDQPLWMSRGGGDGRLPSRRATRRRSAAVSGGGVLMACLVLLAVGLAMAPALPVVADADANATREYDASTGFGAVPSAITAVLAMPTSEFESTPRVSSPVLLPSTIARPISLEQGLAMLSGTGDPSVSFTGTQQVMLRGAGDFISASVEVAQQLAGPLQLTVRGRDGHVVSSGLVVDSSAGESPALPAGTTGFRVARGGQVAGQPTRLLEAHREDGSLVARWWINTRLRLVMWGETFDPGGALVRSAGFATFRPNQYQPAEQSMSTLQLTAAPAKVKSASGAMCGGGFSCHHELAGMSLLEISTDSPTHPTVVHAIYGRGAVRVSVVQQRGQLAPGQKQAYGMSPERLTSTWQSGSVIYTVTTNGSSVLADRVSAELPHEKALGTGTLDRCRSGLQQLFG